MYPDEIGAARRVHCPRRPNNGLTYICGRVSPGRHSLLTRLTLRGKGALLRNKKKQHK